VTFYADMAATASELLAEFGTTATLVRPAVGTYNPAAGTATSTPASHAGRGAMFEYAQRDIDGTVIRQGDMRVYLAADLAVTPQTGDTLTIGGKTWKVMASRPLAPAGVTVIHDCQVRA